ESKGPRNPWPKKGGQPVTGMGVAGSVIRIEQPTRLSRAKRRRKAMTAISHIWNRITGTTWGFRWQYRLQRWRRAWSNATDTLSPDDAGWIRHHCQDVERFVELANS